MKNFKFLIGISIASSILLIGCQQSQTPSTSSTTPPSTSESNTQSTKEIAMQNMAFTENNLTVKIGTKVKWTNNDSVPHTATSDNGLFTSKNLSKGDSFEFTFDKEGTYTYHCAIHPSMKGTITVTK